MNAAETRKPNLFLNYWRKIGAGSLLLSLGIHAVIILIAVLLIKESFVEKPVSFVTGDESTLAKAATETLRQAVKNKKPKPWDQRFPQSRIVIDDPRAAMHVLESRFSDVPMPDSELIAGAGASGLGFNLKGLGGAGVGVGMLEGFTPDSPTLVSRCGGENRVAKIIQNGGTAQCEKAVSQSLAWLKTQQNKDGSWGQQHRGAMTALALLCYLGRCELPDSPFYGPQVQQGLLHLIELGARNEYGVFSERPATHAASYEHGLATYALGEVYALAKFGSSALPGLKPAFEKGVAVIIEHQLPDGGWGYGDGFCYRKTGAGDLSVTGWQFQALKAAKFSGLKFPELHKSIGRAVTYLVSKQTKDGGFGIANREQGYNQWNLTGAGVLGLQMLGDGHHPNETRRGVKFAQAFFAKEPPRWDDNANLYAWYYYAQAFFQNGGEAWKQWNDAALPELLAHQNADGSWQTETASSSVASTGPAGADRALYRATLCTLILEVYYRYLKVGDRAESSVFDRKP